MAAAAAAEILSVLAALVASAVVAAVAAVQAALWAAAAAAILPVGLVDWPLVVALVVLLVRGVPASLFFIGRRVTK